MIWREEGLAKSRKGKLTLWGGDWISSFTTSSTSLCMDLLEGKKKSINIKIRQEVRAEAFFI
jgi:hypothetical protein